MRRRCDVCFWANIESLVYQTYNAQEAEGIFLNSVINNYNSHAYSAHSWPTLIYYSLSCVYNWVEEGKYSWANDFPTLYYTYFCGLLLSTVAKSWEICMFFSEMRVDTAPIESQKWCKSILTHFICQQWIEYYQDSFFLALKFQFPSSCLLCWFFLSLAPMTECRESIDNITWLKRNRKRDLIDVLRDWKFV